MSLFTTYACFFDMTMVDELSVINHTSDAFQRGHATCNCYSLETFYMRRENRRGCESLWTLLHSYRFHCQCRCTINYQKHFLERQFRLSLWKPFLGVKSVKTRHINVADSFFRTLQSKGPERKPCSSIYLSSSYFPQQTLMIHLCTVLPLHVWYTGHENIW